jgi:hypothetical protein
VRSAARSRRSASTIETAWRARRSSFSNRAHRHGLLRHEDANLVGSAAEEDSLPAVSGQPGASRFSSLAVAYATSSSGGTGARGASVGWAGRRARRAVHARAGGGDADRQALQSTTGVAVRPSQRRRPKATEPLQWRYFNYAIRVFIVLKFLCEEAPIATPGVLRVNAVGVNVLAGICKQILPVLRLFIAPRRVVLKVDVSPASTLRRVSRGRPRRVSCTPAGFDLPARDASAIDSTTVRRRCVRSKDRFRSSAALRTASGPRICARLRRARPFRGHPAVVSSLHQQRTRRARRGRPKCPQCIRFPPRSATAIRT